jgi:hypothetical protein
MSSTLMIWRLEPPTTSSAHASNVTSGIVTFSGGALVNNSSLSLDKTGAYPTEWVPQGLGYKNAITISFTEGVSDVSFNLVNHGLETFTITDNLGQLISDVFLSTQDPTITLKAVGLPELPSKRHLPIGTTGLTT